MCTARGSNQGPFGPKSDTLTTAPLRHFSEGIVLVLLLFLTTYLTVFQNCFLSLLYKSVIELSKLLKKVFFCMCFKVVYFISEYFILFP